MLFHSIVAYWCARRGYVSVISRRGPPPPVEIFASFVFTYKMNTTQTKLNFVGLSQPRKYATTRVIIKPY